MSSSIWLTLTPLGIDVASVDVAVVDVAAVDAALVDVAAVDVALVDVADVDAAHIDVADMDVVPLTWLEVDVGYADAAAGGRCGSCHHGPSFASTLTLVPSPLRPPLLVSLHPWGTWWTLMWHG